MTKEEIEKLIENRIKSEFKKHKNLDWAKIASIKIFRSLKEFKIVQPERLSEEDNYEDNDCNCGQIACLICAEGKSYIS